MEPTFIAFLRSVRSVDEGWYDKNQPLSFIGL